MQIPFIGQAYGSNAWTVFRRRPCKTARPKQEQQVDPRFLELKTILGGQTGRHISS